MRRAITLLFIGAVTIIFISQCGGNQKEKKSSKEIPLTAEEMLAGKTCKVYKRTNYVEDGVKEVIPECMVDDVEKFYSDGRYYVLDLGVKCKSSDPDTTESGTWSLNASKDSLFFDGVPVKLSNLTSKGFTINNDHLELTYLAQ